MEHLREIIVHVKLDTNKRSEELILYLTDHESLSSEEFIEMAKKEIEDFVFKNNDN